MAHDDFDEGYFYQPLTFRTDVDSGASSHLARRNELAAVVAFLRSRGAYLFAVGNHNAAETIRALAKDLEDGKHWQERRATLEDQVVAQGSLDQDRCL